LQTAATFDDRETAELWAAYTERIHKEPRLFNAKDRDMYTLRDALEAKYSKDSRECQVTSKWFGPLIDRLIGDVTYDEFLQHALTILNTEIRIKGAKDRPETGILKRPEIQTVIRKYAHLSAGINYLIKHGATLDNEPQKVVTYLREMDKKRKAAKEI
jgi:hypothetical protein